MPFTIPTRSSLLALALSSACALSHAAGNGQIRIDINDALSQRPVDKAKVQIIPRIGKPIEAEVDAKGHVIVDGLEPGLYTVLLTHPDYLATRLPSVRVIDSKTTPVEAELTVARADFEETLVIASAARKDLLSSVGTSERDREALRSSAGSGSDVLRALEGLPGLFSDGEYSSFTVRGNGPRDNLILVDGIPFDNVVHFSDSFGEQEQVEGGGRYSVFAPNLIGRAEFQPGGWDAAHAGKAGSLLKLEVAEGNRDTPAFTTRLDIAGLEIGYDGPSYFHDDTSILLSARSLDFGRLFKTIGIDDVGTPTVTDIIFKSSTELGENHTLNFLGIFANEEFLRDVDNAIASDEDEVGDFVDTDLINNKTDNSLFVATWSALVGSDSEITNKLYHRSYDEKGISGEAFPDLSPIGTSAAEVFSRPNILESQRTETEIGWHLDFSTINTLGKFTSGFRIVDTELDFELVLNENWNQYTFETGDSRPDEDQYYIVYTPESVNNNYTQNEMNLSAYINQEINLDTWEFRGGLRYDRDNFSDESIVSPRVGATWLTTDDLRITATAGRYHQAPRFNDRASDAGNASLKNELVDQVSVGFAYALSSEIELFIEPYYQDLKNLIVKQDGVDLSYANTGEGSSYGLDTAITRQFDNGWSANMTYSYNKARIKNNANEEYFDADFNRPHSFSLGGIWEISPRWKLSARWKWASGKPSDTYLIHNNVHGDGEILRYSRETLAHNTDRYDSFNSLNFRMDYRRAFGRTNLIAFIDVINALGSSNNANSEFNPRSGKDVTEEGEALPLFGLRFEW